MNIKQISFYGFMILIFGLLLSGSVLVFFLFKLENIRNDGHKAEVAYQSFLKVKYNSERLLTTYNLSEDKKKWQNSVKQFDKKLQAVHNLKYKEMIEIKNLWAVCKNRDKKYPNAACKSTSSGRQNHGKAAFKKTWRKLAAK